ncbi:MAG: hypothetical protein ABI550_06830 [Ignavibacteriaceae bacterium]
MTRNILNVLFVSLIFSQLIFAQDPAKTSSSNLNQYYGGKFGFYNPSDGLNNGLLIGVDGITEFKNYNFFLSGAVDLYYKKSIDIFENPKPFVNDQQIILLPIHINFGYKLLQVEDADTKIYAGVGGGYYLYFYSVTYQNSSGGIFPNITPQSDQINGGNIFFSIFTRFLIGKIFVEPRYYLASSEEKSTGGNIFKVNPTGFAITLGFQY